VKKYEFEAARVERQTDGARKTKRRMVRTVTSQVLGWSCSERDLSSATARAPGLSPESLPPRKMELDARGTRAPPGGE
jgi:hypothetical protein